MRRKAHAYDLLSPKDRTNLALAMCHSEVTHGSYYVARRSECQAVNTAGMIVDMMRKGNVEEQGASSTTTKGNVEEQGASSTTTKGNVEEQGASSTTTKGNVEEQGASSTTTKGNVEEQGASSTTTKGITCSEELIILEAIVHLEDSGGAPGNRGSAGNAGEEGPFGVQGRGGSSGPVRRNENDEDWKPDRNLLDSLALQTDELYGKLTPTLPVSQKQFYDKCRHIMRRKGLKN